MMTAPPATPATKPAISRRMSALEQLQAEKKTSRLIQLIIGLLGYGASLTFLIESTLGSTSWNILAEGIAERSGLTFGLVTNIIALVVLVFWIPLRELPGLGTVLNVLLVGTAADIVAPLLPDPTSLDLRILYFCIGMLAMAFFDAMYLGARFGSGPRDGLMTGGVRVTGWPIWVVRLIIDVVVVTIGWLLGGTFGVGTLLLAFGIGPLVQRFLKVTTVHLAADRATLSLQTPDSIPEATK